MWKALKGEEQKLRERTVNKTIFLLACFARYRCLSVGYLNGLCSKCKDFSFSLCAVDSVSTSVSFPKIPLIHFNLSNLSVYSRISLSLNQWIRIRFQYLIAKVVLINKLMLEMHVSF